MSTLLPPTLAEIREAAARLRDVVVTTPATPLHGPGTPRDIFLKLEILQPTRSFKIRGVYHAVARLSESARSIGISTVSAGNTAQALAWTGRRFGIPARSIMPDHAPQTKIDAVRELGGEPVLLPIDDVFRYLKEHRWESEPYAFIHPWTNRDVMIGHGTMGLEIVEQCPEVETVFVPVGGGGLMGGVGSALHGLRPDIRIIAVEPEGCPSLHHSLAAGEPVSVECHTICDGVAVPYMTEEMFPILRNLVDESVLVSEDDVRATIRRLARDNRIVAEGAGALATAAALVMPYEERGVSVAIVTGGNIDADRLAAILVNESADAPEGIPYHLAR